MKITKQQLIESLDREEYSITELQNKIKSFFSQKDADSKKEIAKELHLHFQSLITSQKIIMTKRECLFKLYRYLNEVCNSFYEHIQNARRENGDNFNKPDHFSSLLECQTDMLIKILTVAEILNLDFYRILFEGEEPYIEEYACACEFTEYLESLENNLDAAENTELEVTLGSCVDMVAPSREERLPFYESLLQVKEGLLG